MRGQITIDSYSALILTPPREDKLFRFVFSALPTDSSGLSLSLFCLAPAFDFLSVSGLVFPTCVSSVSACLRAVFPLLSLVSVPPVGAVPIEGR